MKKKISIIFSLVLALSVVFTNTGYAKQFVNPSILRLTAQGYSEEEAYYAFAVFCLAHPEDSRIAKIIVRYRECGDWDEVFSFYNVDRNAIEEFIKTQKDALKRSEIPDEIYEEMVDFGMTDKECEQFAREVYILHAYYDDIDLSIAWEAQKKGKTPTDLLNERQAIMQARWQLVEAVVMRKSTVKECITEMKKENPDMTMGEIIEFVNKELKDWETFLISASKLTEEEIMQAEEAGMTNFFDVFYLKQACRNYGFSYTELLEEIKNGTDVDTVVERRVTPELVEETKRKLGVDDSTLEMLE